MKPIDATCDELIAAGWGEHDRRDIPSDWQTRRPATIPKTHRVACLCGDCSYCRGRASARRYREARRGAEHPVGGWKKLLRRGRKALAAEQK